MSEICKHHWQLEKCDDVTDTWKCVKCEEIETAPCNFDEMYS